MSPPTLDSGFRRNDGKGTDEDHRSLPLTPTPDADYRTCMSTSTNFYLGCAVWAYKGWLGDFFPASSRAADFLRLYSQRLTAVEINATFYGVPSRDTVTRWAEETPPGFQFCPKLPRDLTHRGLLQPSIPHALTFGKLMQTLGDRLGPIFVQLPPQYGPTMLNDLHAFLSAWPREEIPLAVEVRHLDWFREPHAHALTSLLESLGVGRVLLDTRPIYEGPDDPQIGMNDGNRSCLCNQALLLLLAWCALLAIHTERVTIYSLRNG